MYCSKFSLYARLFIATIYVAATLKKAHGHFDKILLVNMLAILPLVVGPKLFCQQQHEIQIRKSFN